MGFEETAIPAFVINKQTTLKNQTSVFHKLPE